MQWFKKWLIFLFLPLVAFTGLHKFYISVTQVAYSQEEEALQITSRIFIDDFESVLKERYGLEPHLATKAEDPDADSYVEKYLRSKFLVSINGKPISFNYLGKQYDNDILVCYFEIPNVPFESLHSLEIENDLLTDLYEEQKNIVHIFINGEKKSFVLVRENNKALLNF